MFDLTKFKFPTAVETVEQGRQYAATVATYITDKKMKDVYQAMANANLNVAATIAEKYDEAVKQSTDMFNKTFKINA